MCLSLALLGDFQITLDGEPVAGFESDKVRALLVYLAVESDRPHRRDALAEMFWPDRPPGVARNNLKQALSNLRKAIGDQETDPPFLQISRMEIQFNPDSAFMLDVRACSALLAACQSHRHRRVETCKLCIRRLREAVALYRGPFLEQFYLGDSAAFEEWALVQREGLQRRVMEAFPRLVTYHERRGEYRRACEFARRQVELEPWDEVAQRQLMRALALGGRQSAAMRQYLVCRRTLADELGLEPTPETTQLFEQIRAGKYGRPAPPPRKTSAKTGDSSKARPFGPRAWAVILFLAISLALAAWLVKLNSNQTAVAPENPVAPSPAITHTARATATDPHPGDTPTTVYPFTGQKDIPRTEYQALVVLYDETQGPGWKDSSGWLSDATPCGWPGVTCREGSVVELDLHNNDLNGHIPPEIGLLTELTVLNLEFNQLGGSIPPELGTLRRLNSLALDNNLFDGPIPPELGDLLHLTSLDLRHNWLSGDFPPELGNLSSLVYLDLSDNVIGGSIPPQLGNLSNLVFASLGGNQLSGPLPPELGNLSSLVSLNVQGNKSLDGPIPPEIGQLSNLGLLDLSDNQFSGSLPPELGDLTNLLKLYVGWNPLSGPLPSSLTNLDLETFYFDGTDLCEPPDAAFQEWLNGIQNSGGTGIPCPTDAYSPAR